MSKRSLNHRKDIRTEEQFKKDIKESTKRESHLLDLWIAYMTSIGYDISYEDNGINNNGDFVQKSDCRPDYKITINGETALYDIKGNKYKHKNTFKVYDLEQYLSYSANILLMYGMSENWDLNKDARYAIITTEQIRNILTTCPRTKQATWGNKEVVIIYEKDFDKYFTIKEFNFE